MRITSNARTCIATTPARRALPWRRALFGRSSASRAVSSCSADGAAAEVMTTGRSIGGRMTESGSLTGTATGPLAARCGSDHSAGGRRSAGCANGCHVCVRDVGAWRGWVTVSRMGMDIERPREDGGAAPAPSSNSSPLESDDETSEGEVARSRSQ
jgi:hypothetical protein